MRGRRAAVVLTLAAFTGCASMRENPNLCKVATIGTGALLGATAGGLISGVAADHGDSGGSKNWEIGLSTAGGTAVGGLAGALLAHMICKEPEPEPVAAPPPPPPPPSGTKIATIPGPNFAFDKSTLTAEGRSRVATAAATLQQHSSVDVYVDGYTDSIGSDKYNMALGERRANTVAKALAEEGVSPSRMTVRSFGKERPVASNATAAGRAENRRVEIVVR